MTASGTEKPLMSGEGGLDKVVLMKLCPTLKEFIFSEICASNITDVEAGSSVSH